MGTKIEDRRSKIERKAAEVSDIEPDWQEFAVEESLEQVGGGEGVELALFAEVGEFFAGTLAGGELLFGFEGAEALIDEEKFNTRACGQMAAPIDGFLGGGAEGVVHVQGKAEDDSFDAFGGDETDDGIKGIGGRIDLQDFVGGGEFAAFVAEGEADAAIA